jgi:hypothetical protein
MADDLLDAVVAAHRLAVFRETDQWVSFGDGLALPERLRATLRPHDRRRPACELWIGLEHGKPVCTGVRFDRQDDEAPALTMRVLKEAPIGGYVRAAVAQMAAKPTRDEELGTGKAFMLDGERAWRTRAGGAITWQQALSDAQAERRPRRRAGIQVDLAEVARVYRQALAMGAHPTQAVKDHWHISRTHASRYIGRAREAGELGPAAPRRAGEFNEQEQES